MPLFCPVLQVLFWLLLSSSRSSFSRGLLRSLVGPSTDCLQSDPQEAHRAGYSLKTSTQRRPRLGCPNVGGLIKDVLPLLFTRAAGRCSRPAERQVTDFLIAVAEPVSRPWELSADWLPAPTRHWKSSLGGRQTGMSMGSCWKVPISILRESLVTGLQQSSISGD